MYTPYAGDAGIFLLMKEKLTIGNVKSSRLLLVLFLFLICCRFQGEGQSKKRTFKCQ